MTFNPEDLKTTVVSETKEFTIWKAEEPDGETTWHLELGQVTLHFFAEEWQELLSLFEALKQA